MIILYHCPRCHAQAVVERDSRRPFAIPRCPDCAVAMSLGTPPAAAPPRRMSHAPHLG